MPHRKKGEPLSDYVYRCVAHRQKEHPNEGRDHSIKICHEMAKSPKWQEGAKRKGKK
jgi:hypothetical protein